MKYTFDCASRDMGRGHNEVCWCDMCTVYIRRGTWTFTKMYMTLCLLFCVCVISQASSLLVNKDKGEDGTGGVEEASHSPSTSELDTQNADEHSISIESSLTRDSQPPATEVQMHMVTDENAAQTSESQHSEQLESDVDRKVADPIQSSNCQVPRTGLQSQNILDPHPSEAPPTALLQSEGLPLQSEAPSSDLLQSESLPLQSEAPSSDLPQSEGLPLQSEAPPTDLQQSVIPHTDLQQLESQPTDLPQSKGPPTNLPQSEGPPMNSQQSEGRATDLQQSEGLATAMLSSKISGRPDKNSEDNYQGDTQMKNVEDHTTSKSDDIKDSTVGSPQLTHHTSSPLNSVSLEGEVTLLKKTGEVKATRKEELKSTLLKSAGIQLQQGSQHSTQEYTTSQNSNVGASELPEQPPTRQDKPLSIPLTKYDSPSLDDRNLEQFSEILLDSDLSPSDSELEPSGQKQKVEKRVRFADEVEALWKGGATASGWSVLSYFPLQIQCNIVMCMWQSQLEIKHYSVPF